jgi:uncharacterized protein YcaQ
MTALRADTAIARAITPAVVRRLALTRQRLAGPRPATGAAGIMEVARDLGALQLDPINVVARSHLLVLRSRLGHFAPGAVATLLYEERQLFEYWAHCASLVLTEDYPIHRLLMRRRLADETATGTPQNTRAHAWVAENRALAAYVLDRLATEGPLPLVAFEDRAVSGWTSTGWTSGRNVARMIDHLWLRGEVMVAGRTGIHRLWDRSERVLPPWTPRDEWSEHATVRAAAQRAIRALGVARPTQIAQHFTRGRYPGLAGALAELVAEGLIAPVALVPPTGDAATVRAWAGPWYVHTADLPLMDRLAADGAGDEWGPRTTLLSPFDNLICDRKRTKLLFDFDFTIEIYVPQAKRRWGYYVLPILHGDRLIGRVDPTMDRANGRLVINAIHAEPGVPHLGRAGGAVARAIAELGRFLGAREIVYPETVPAPWARALKRA